MQLLKKIFFSLLVLSPLSGYSVDNIWSQPITLNETWDQVFNVGMDGRGASIAAFESQCNPGVFVKTMATPGTTWSEAITLSSTGYQPQVVVNNAGFGVVIWYESSGAEQVYASTNPDILDPLGWSLPVNLSAATLVNANDPSDAVLAIDPNSPFTVVTWTREDTNNLQNIQAAIYNFPIVSAWNLPGDSFLATDIDPSSITANISVSCSSDTFAAITFDYTSQTTSLPSIGIVFYNAIGTPLWSTPLVVDEGNVGFPKIILNASASQGGSVFWEDVSIGATLKMTFVNELGSLSSSTFTLTPPSTHVAEYNVVLNSDNNAYVLYSNSNTNQIEAIFVDGGTTSASFIVSGSGSFTVTSPCIGIDNSDSPYALWTQEDGPDSFIYSSIFNVATDTAWQTPVLLNQGNSSFSPSLSINPTLFQQGVSGWTSYTDNLSSSAFLVVPNPENVSSFTGTSIKEIFLTGTNLVNHLVWSPSTDVTVTSYALYRNGALLATIPLHGPFVYNDFNRVKNVADTYVLKTVTADSIESSGLTVILP